MAGKSRANSILRRNTNVYDVIAEKWQEPAYFVWAVGGSKQSLMSVAHCLLGQFKPKFAEQRRFMSIDVYFVNYSRL